MNQYFGPEYERSAFHCLHCGVYANQYWYTWHQGGRPTDQVPKIEMSTCAHCGKHALWNDGQLVFPAGLIGPIPAEDMPDPVRSIYEEARAVASASQRAAAALLRVAVETLVDDIEPGKAKLNTKIGKLVDRGLDPQIQQMLDTVRVFGNEGGAHPGEINMNEQPETLGMLMFCVNTIVERLITYPKRIAEAYSALSPEKRKGIEDRDRYANEQRSSDQ